MKKCGTCKEIKGLEEFHINKVAPQGRFFECKLCRKDRSKSDYLKRKDKIKKDTNSYYYKNKEKIQIHKNLYQKHKVASDPKTKITRNLRNRLWYALTNKMWKKNTSFADYIGLNDYQDLVVYIESKFTEGMTWDNYGEWHIDHIVPLSSANSKEEMYKLCHYTNLQPLWAKDNLSKYNKI